MADKTVAVILRAVTGQYQAEMARAAASTAAVGTAAKGTTGTVGGLRGVLGPAGLAAARTAAAFAGPAALAYGLTASASAAIDFESDFAGVRKTVEGSPRELANIALGFRQMSTEIPASTTQLTAVGEAAGQLGIETPNVLAFSRVMVDLGNTTNLEANVAAQALARLANITQMPQSEFDRLGSTVVALGNNLATNESEIVEFGLRIAGAGTQVGLTEAEILSLGASLAELGINAEAGGTAISRVMIEVDTAVASGGAELEAFADIAGVSAEQFARHWERDPVDALISFIAGLDRVEESGGNVFQVLENMGLSEVRVRDALLRTSGAAEQLAGNVELGTQAWEDNNALTAEAETRYATTASKIEVAKNSIRNLGVEIGELLLPVIGEFAESTTDALNSTTDLVNEIEDRGLMIFPGFRARINDTTGSLEVFRSSSFAAADAAHGLMSEARGLNEHQARLTSSTSLYGAAADDAAAATGEYGDAVASSADDVAELTDEQKELAEAIRGYSDPASGYFAFLDEKEEKERSAAEATAASTKKSSDSWEDYYTDVDGSISDVIKSLQRQIRAQEDWEKNLVAIAKRGGAGIAKELAKLGPEGADLVADFADATDKQFQRAAKLWVKQTAAGGEESGRTLEEKLDRAADKGQRGTEDVTRRMGREIDAGVRRWAQTVDGIPPATRDALELARDKGRTGAARTTAAINSQLLQGVRRGASVIDGYAGALAAGVNPVLVSVRGKRVPVGSSAARAYIAKLRADGAVDFPTARQFHSRPPAHITHQPTTLFGEPETHGEGFVPLAPSKAPRSRAITSELARRLGGRVDWGDRHAATSFAEGGFSSVKDVPAAPSFDMLGSPLRGAGRGVAGHTRREVVEWLKENLAPQLGPGIGWQAMMAALNQRFGSVQLISGYRPGAITATGNPSYHGAGRAVDIPPNSKYAQWIRDNYMSQTREMIFSPFGSRQIWNGRNHVYSGITRAMHWGHVHWAMAMGGIISKEILKRLPDKGVPVTGDADLDVLPFHSFDQGGMLPQGLSVAYNGTGAPEPVGQMSLDGVRVVLDIPELGGRLDGRIRTVNAADASRRSHQQRKVAA